MSRDWSAIASAYEGGLERIVAVVRRYVRNDEAAHDVAHDAFVRAMERLEMFDGRASLTTWITSIAIHLALDHLRRRPALPLSLETVARSPGPLEVAHSREMEERVAGAVGGLPVALAMVFRLAMDGRSGREIAAMAGCSEAAARGRLHYARARLRGAYRSACGTPTPTADMIRRARATAHEPPPPAGLG